MTELLLRNGFVVDPVKLTMPVQDVLIKNGQICKVGPKLRSAGRTIDCTGKHVCRGLGDMHVHFRTPGQEAKETLASGGMAALAGGFTWVLGMANTSPVIDTGEKVHQVLVLAENPNLIDYHQVIAATLNQEGKVPADLLTRRNIAVSDDGKGIQDPEVLLQVMRNCHWADTSLLLHCQDNRFGFFDRRAEIYYISLVLTLAEIHQLAVHIQHVSCKESVELIRLAKAKKVPVTCETAPHYFSLTAKHYRQIGINAHMNPPLRNESDRQAIIIGLKDRTIDAIATDHAPHTQDDKEGKDGKPSAPGVIGLETAVAVTYSALSNHLTVPEIIAKLTINPAQILGLAGKGTITAGQVADLVVIDPKKRKKVEPDQFYSKARNCPWAHKVLQGWPVLTIRCGQIVMEDGKFRYS